jgi:hypothetical protein
MIERALFRGGLFSKDLIHIALLNTRRVAALVEILFFGAIPNHAGMGNSRSFDLDHNRSCSLAY